MGLLKEFDLQLYSLRELLKDGFPDVLKRVAEIGYTGVEFAGYGGLTAEEMSNLLKENGLKSVSSHVPLERLTNALDEELDYNRKLGTQAIIVPYYPVANAQDVEILAGQLTTIAKSVREAGFAFGYHNHAHEFKKSEDGTYLLDLLMQMTDPLDILLELDVYWATYADVDVMEYIQKQKDRIRLLHIKQIADFESKKCVDLDEGALDFGAIIRTGRKIGVGHFILEQEEFAVSPYQSIEKGYKYIMNL